jgi:hypothetical protein
MARRGSRLRLVRIAALLLLAAAVINVLVAWACVVPAPPPRAWGTVASPNLREAMYRFYERAEWQPLDTRVTVRTWRGVDEVRASGLLRWNDPERGTSLRLSHVVMWHAGWPCRSLACAVRTNEPVVGGFPASWLTVSVPGDPQRPLPYTPCWPGLAVNTALYAAVLATGFVGFRWWRFRRRPGSCKACGYDLAGNVGGVCPECGAKV